VPYVVVRASLKLAEVHRQDRLRPLQRLDLRFLVDREDHGIRRRRHVQSHDFPNLLHELWIERDLEALGTMRLQPERAPDAAHHRVTDTRRLGHGPSTPKRRAGWRGLEGLHDHGLDLLIGDGARRADARLVIQPLQLVLDELPTPRRDRRLRCPQAARHCRVRPVDTRQHDPGTKRHCTIHAARFVNRTSAARGVGNRDFSSGASNLSFPGDWSVFHSYLVPRSWYFSAREVRWRPTRWICGRGWCVDAESGIATRDVAAKYTVSLSWVNRLKRRKRARGEIRPRKQTKFRGWTLTTDREERFVFLITAKPDATLAELREALLTTGRRQHAVAHD
jgi:hypothetical protein